MTIENRHIDYNRYNEVTTCELSESDPVGGPIWPTLAFASNDICLAADFRAAARVSVLTSRALRFPRSTSQADLGATVIKVATVGGAIELPRPSARAQIYIRS